MNGSILELDDIQSGVLRPRPTPYQATYIIFRIDDRKAGRELMRRLSRVVASAAHPTSPTGSTWVSAALSFQGLKALGVPRASLESGVEDARAVMSRLAASGISMQEVTDTLVTQGVQLFSDAFEKLLAAVGGRFSG